MAFLDIITICSTGQETRPYHRDRSLFICKISLPQRRRIVGIVPVLAPLSMISLPTTPTSAPTICTNPEKPRHITEKKLLPCLRGSNKTTTRRPILPLSSQPWTCRHGITCCGYQPVPIRKSRHISKRHHITKVNRQKKERKKEMGLQPLQFAFLCSLLVYGSPHLSSSSFSLDHQFDPLSMAHAISYQANRNNSCLMTCSSSLHSIESKKERKGKA
jgi:hypothetical protein